MRPSLDLATLQWVPSNLGYLYARKERKAELDVVFLLYIFLQRSLRLVPEAGCSTYCDSHVAPIVVEEEPFRALVGHSFNGADRTLARRRSKYQQDVLSLIGVRVYLRQADHELLQETLELGASLAVHARKFKFVGIPLSHVLQHNVNCIAGALEGASHTIKIHDHFADTAEVMLSATVNA